MDPSLYDLDVQYGNIRDMMSMYVQIQTVEAKKEMNDQIMFRSFKLVIELLFYIIRHKH